MSDTVTVRVAASEDLPAVAALRREWLRLAPRAESIPFYERLEP